MSKIFNTRPIGNTSLNVSTLGFGAASIGNLYQAVSDQEATATLTAAISSGMNLFDTAPHYGAGLSERRVGNALRSLPKERYILSSKVGRLLKPDSQVDVTRLRHGFHTPMPFETQYDYTYDGIMRSFEDSLQRLGLAAIDILLVHDIGEYTHGQNDKHYFKQFEKSGYKALEELKKSYNLVIYFRDEKLFVGSPFTEQLGRVKYHFQKNANVQDLKYRLAQEIRIKLRAVSMLPDNSKIEVTEGDSDGELRVLHFYNLQEAELRKQAAEKINFLKYDGYGGTFQGMGRPFATHGMIAELSDDHYPEREGSYFIDEIEVDYNDSVGYKRYITLGKTA